MNNTKLDVHHKKWLSIINDLHDSLIKNDAGDYCKTSEESVNAMLDYVRFHFDDEKEYMRKINYPDWASHQEKLAKFYVQIKCLYSNVMGGNVILNTEIMDTLTNWFQDHILNEDKKYSMYAASVVMQI